MVFINFIVKLVKRFIAWIRPFLNVIAVILGIGLPLFIYLAFIAEEPVFEPEVDIELGRRTVLSIEADSTEYPILDRDQYSEAYEYIQNMVTELTSGPDIKFDNMFKYDSVQIINRDDVLNAFCAPGGYIYVYTGLMKYLDEADHLAGVLGHEIAHAELRHSAIRLQKEFGQKRIFEFVLLSTPIGISNAISLKILNDLTNLKYSRKQEANADKYSVLYLSNTHYACNGAAGFFRKLLSAGDDVNMPIFLSDHPGSQSRVDNINKDALKAGCNTNSRDQASWKKILKTLPETD